MPTYKHPCPHCSKWIERDVRACPYCGTADPFAPGRCPACRAIIDDPSWVACPKCGASLKKEPAAPAEGADAPADAAAPSEGPSTADAPTDATGAAPSTEPAAEARRCSGCAAPLAAGARFCTACGTLAPAG